MNKVLQFYDYEKCFQHYAERIAHMRQAKIKGEVIVAKPVFLLALLSELDGQPFSQRYFTLETTRIEYRYNSLMKKYTEGSQFPNPTSVNYPFWHLAKDGFWHVHLYPKKEYKGKSTPSVEWLKEHVLFANFDEDLVILLHNEEYRNKMRDFITDLIDSQKKK